MTPTNPQPEMEISTAAIECAFEIENNPDLSIHDYEKRIQLAINQSTAPLRGEVERLKKERHACAVGIIESREAMIQNLALKDQLTTKREVLEKCVEALIKLDKIYKH